MNEDEWMNVFSFKHSTLARRNQQLKLFLISEQGLTIFDFRS